MSYILVATDFTETGNNAVDYAAQLAVSLNQELCLTHFYTLPVSYGELPMPEMSVAEIRTMSEETMSGLVKTVSASYPSIKVSYSVIFDDVEDGITDYTNQNGAPAFVVLGNSVSGDDTFSFLEGALISLFKHFHYPVLAIPQGIAYKELKHLCFAFDNKHHHNEVALTQLKNITSLFGAQLHVFNAVKDVYSRDNLIDIDNNVKDFLATVTPLPKYHIEYDVNLENAIENFVKVEKIDWLAVLPRTYPFFESLFHKSHSKALAHKINIPLLVLHEE